MHNQATFNFMFAEAEDEDLAHAISPESAELDYVLDKNFRPRDWVLGVEAKKGEQAREWGVKPGEALTYEYYSKLNKRFPRNKRRWSSSVGWRRKNKAVFPELLATVSGGLHPPWRHAKNR